MFLRQDTRGITTGNRDFLGRWKSIWKILYEGERSVASFFAVTKLEKYEYSGRMLEAAQLRETYSSHILARSL